MKKMLSFLLSIVMVFSIVFSTPLIVNAEDTGVCGENVTWTLSDSGTLTISGTGDMFDYASPGDVPWVSTKFDIYVVVINEGVESIGDYAFYYFPQLIAVTIPDGVKRIGDYAFQMCSSLQAIKIPDSVTAMGDYVFAGCSALYSIIFSENLTSIGDSAFVSCSGFETITLPDSITSIGKNAFENCISLEGITVPDNVTTIGESAFESCSSLKAVTLGKKVVELEPRVFYSCIRLVSVAIPDSMTHISDSVFYNCPKLEYVFYTGTEDEWPLINIGPYNPDIADVTMHYQTADHISEEWIIDEKATCKVVGSKHKVCTICQAVFGVEEIPKTGHKSSDWYVAKEATTKAPGHKCKTCTVCGVQLEFKRIPQLKCAAPKLKSVVNTSTGIKFTWGKVTGADYYEIYRKTGNGDWKKIATVKGSASSYTDKNVKSGTTYKYTVKAKNEAGVSKYYTKGLTIKCIADPVLKTPTSAKKGITLKWNKIRGAQGYAVYRKAGNGSYRRLATVKGATKVSYLDKSAKKGVKYTYKLRAYSGKTYSAYSNTKSIKDKY